jgi:uncharacterized protein (TIGR03086 family)
MEPDLLDLYRRGSAWSADKVPAALPHLSAPSTCDRWDVRTLLNHILQIQRYFLGMAQGNEIALTPDPPDLLSDDPVSDFQTVRTEVLRAFGEPGTVERTGIALAVAFSDQLVHGWDLAISTRQDPTLPEGLAEAAFSMIYGRFTDEQRQGLFKPALSVDDAARAQDKLLAYTGRDPRRAT